MKIDIFTLCDGVYLYGDKLTVIGMYDVLVLQNLTAAPVTLNIAAHIIFDADECGNNVINIYGEDIETGSRILDLKQKLLIRKRDKIDSGTLNVSLSGVPVIFPRPSKYKFTLEVEGRGKSETILNVLSSR